MSRFPETRISLILRLAAAQDVEAWREFTAIYAPAVYATARRRGLQSADAEDFIQELLLAVARAAGRCTEPKRVEIKVAVPSGMDMDMYGGMGGMAMIALEDAKDLPAGLGQNEAATGKLSSEECTNIAQLIRLDIWIEDARQLLRRTAGDADEFKAPEDHLKSLLTEEYDAQLLKQRGYVARLSDKLKRLQEELERRAQAKTRVVDVQLGKLVLEAQGLMSDER